MVIVLQLMGSFTAFFGPFSTAVALIPIAIGAVMCGPAIGAWLGFVFGAVVLISGGAFLAISVPGTVITVLLKGMMAGLAAGLICEVFEKKNRTLAVILAAIVCPLVNTGIFLLGCGVFFLDTVTQWGAGMGYDNVGVYLIFGMVGINFLVEMGMNIFLSPVVVKLLNVGKRV